MSKRFVVMVGGPAAGKSTVAKKLFAELPIVDCDAIKAERSDYDPKQPHLVHEWSSVEATRRVLALLSRGESCVFDSTGANVEKLSTFIAVAREAGMVVEAVYVTCSVEVAVQRNAQRERTVNVEMLRERHAVVAATWSVVKNMVSVFTVVENN